MFEKIPKSFDIVAERQFKLGKSALRQEKALTVVLRVVLLLEEKNEITVHKKN
jgi:DNA-binding ferritin-like protein